MMLAGCPEDCLRVRDTGYTHVSENAVPRESPRTKRPNHCDMPTGNARKRPLCKPGAFRSRSQFLDQLVQDVEIGETLCHAGHLRSGEVVVFDVVVVE